MRQLTHEQVVPPLAPIGSLRPVVRTLLEDRGISFVEETEYDRPGPTRWAVVELGSGAQFLIQHHYKNDIGVVVISGQVGTATPAELCHQFASALELSDDDFTWIAPKWLKPYAKPADQA